MAGVTTASLAADVRRRFRDAGLDEADLDARLLVAAGLGVAAGHLVARGDVSVTAEEVAAVEALAGRRLAGEPVGRILGEREFWSLPFRLGPDVLEPRPDTETVVEAALAATAGMSGRLRIADLGTGSGAILVALLSERREAVGVGIDRAPGAVAVARENAEAAGVGPRALFAVGDFAAPLADGYDLVVSNPPYIRSGEMAALPAEVRLHDPRLALDGGPDGLDAYRAILERIDLVLAPGAAIVFETGADAADAVAALVAAKGLQVEEIRHDLAGRQRVVTGRWSGGKIALGNHYRSG